MEHLSCRSSTILFEIKIYLPKANFLMYKMLYIFLFQCRFMFVFPRESRAVVSRERNAYLRERKQTREEKEKVKVRNRCLFSQVASRQ